MDKISSRTKTSISGKLVRTAALLAFMLGLLVSAIQIMVSFKNIERQSDVDMQALIGLIRGPATAVLYSLDEVVAKELLDGALKYPGVIRCRLILPDLKPFSVSERPKAKGSLRLFSDWALGEVLHYSWELYSEPEGEEGGELIGTLDVEVDVFSYGYFFLKQSLATLSINMLYVLLLSCGLLVVFHIQVGRPLKSVIHSIAELDFEGGGAARLSEPAGHATTEIGMLVRLTNQHLHAIAITLDQLYLAKAELKKSMEGLEKTVAERTHELSDSVRQLQAAQNQLIESEKLAALGGLVAGVAHEVNTPLGIAVTASSVLSEALSDLDYQFAEQTLSSSSFQSLLGQALDSNAILFNNIKRAAKLISDFKQTAVDQVSEARSNFSVFQVISALIASLHPETRRVPVEPVLICPPDLQMNSLPGVLTQVVSNLVINSVRHAFGSVSRAEITITFHLVDDQVILKYSDNGVGVPVLDHERIFEPFFTTKRGSGGSGLGLNIVYNLVTRKLGGRLEFSSEPGRGVNFILYLPQACVPTVDKSSS